MRASVCPYVAGWSVSSSVRPGLGLADPSVPRLAVRRDAPETPRPRATARRPSGRRTAPTRRAAAPGTLTATSWPRAISLSAQRRGSSATPSPISTARLMPSRLGSDDLDVERRVTLFVEPQHALARRRRIVVRDDRLAPDLLDRDPLACRRADDPGCAAAPARRCRARSTAAPCSGGLNVSTPKSTVRSSTSCAICRDGTRRTSTSDLRMLALRTRSMSGSSECTAASLAPMTHAAPAGRRWRSRDRRLRPRRRAAAAASA